MFLLYTDESGALTDPTNPILFLSGVAIFDRKTHWVEKELIAISERFRPEAPFAIEFWLTHALR